jgi:TPR repeat protein
MTSPLLSPIQLAMLRQQVGQNPVGVYKLARRYEKGGGGIPLNLREAINLYRLSAKKNYPPAQYQLGICCYEGKGIERSIPKAIEWLNKAKDRGYEAAQLELSSIKEKHPEFFAIEETKRVVKRVLPESTDAPAAKKPKVESPKTKS